tara:strand:+ start:462 stop:1613 length:1152 start_codon:yes stop_codon:yes gene_type:complete
MNYVAMALNSREMSIMKIKKIMSSGLENDKHCYLALEQLFKELPYDKMNSLGKISFNSLLKRSLKTREKFKKYKKIHQNKLNQIKITKPIFITGFPRSGTTLLQNLLIKNFQIEGIQFWELLNPIPQIKYKKIDDLLRKINACFLISIVKTFGPKINAMHPMKFSSYEECWHLFLPTFNVYNFDLQFSLQNYGSWISKNSIQTAYEEYSDILKIILYQRKKENIILKCPEHMMFANNISKTFHDSTLICIHRDPVKSITSYTNMIYEINKFYKQNVQKKDVAEYVVKKFNEMTKTMLHSMKKSNGNIINIQYMDLIKNRTKTIEFLSSKCNIEIKKEMSNQDQHDFNKLKSKINNEPEKLGIHPNEIYSKFNNYMQEFNVIKE